MKIKKISQYIEGGASLSNVYGTSNEDGYTQQYINNLVKTEKTTSDIDTYGCNYINNLYDHRFSNIDTGSLAGGATYNKSFSGGCKLIWVRISAGNFEEQKLFAVLGPNGYVKTAQELATVSYHNLTNANVTISITTSGPSLYVTCKNTGTVSLSYQIVITNIGP